MTMSFELAGAIIDAVLRAGTYTGPRNLYVGLCDGDPSQGGAEISGMGYQRLPTRFGAAVAGVAANSEPVAFPVALTAWGRVTHAAVYPAPSASAALFAVPLNVDQDIAENDRVTFAAGDLTFGIT